MRCDWKELEGRRGALSAYHKVLTFLVNDSAGKGKEVIEDAD